MHALTRTHATIFFRLLMLSMCAMITPALAQTDQRFGTVGREGAERLNLTLYRDYQRQNNEATLPGKEKHFIVGQFTNRSDTLGIDWQWYLLDLLEQPNSLLLQNFLNLAIDLIHNEAVPVVRDAWLANRDALETQWENTVNGTSKTWKKEVLGVTIYSYTVSLSDTEVNLPEELPEIQLTVAPDGEHINLLIEMNVTWSTQAQGSRKTIHAWPTFNTKVSLIGTIEFSEDEQGRYLAINEIHGQSVTDAQGSIEFKVNILGIGDISFTWSKLDMLIQSNVDNAIASGIGQIMNIDQNHDGQPDLAQRFYFEPFLSKTFFDGKPVPRQQEIVDRVFAQEADWITTQIVTNKQLGKTWEIGNEPNWFPLMRPAQYAELYARYYQHLKSLDPTARCMIGGLFLTEAIDNPREVVAAMIPAMFGIFREELATFISASLFQTSTPEWFETFRAALPAEVRVDIGNFHLYPMAADAPTFELATVQPQIEALASSFVAGGVDEIWVTEFGNIDWRRTEQEVAALCTDLSTHFKTNGLGIQRWYWSRSMGYDKRFDAIGKKPISALLAADGVTLTSIGQAYLLASGSQITEVAGTTPAATLPKTLALAPSYPNPFSIGRSASTKIVYGLPLESEVTVRIYDVLGRQTRQLTRNRQAAGSYELLWDGRNDLGETVASGIYLAVLQAGSNRLAQKIVVTR